MVPIFKKKLKIAETFFDATKKFITKTFCLQKLFVILQCPNPRFRTGWGDTTLWKASLMLCFWTFERRKLKSHSKAVAEMNATG